MLPGCLYLVAPHVMVAWARETIFARLLERKKIIPFFWLDCNCMLYPTPFCHILSTYSEEIWWCLLPCPLTNWSQVPAPLITSGIRVENHRICVFLQRAKPRNRRAPPCPRRATICYPQICNCIAAFLLSSDVKAVRAMGPVIGKPLILGGAIIGCLRPAVASSLVHARTHLHRRERIRLSGALGPLRNALRTRRLRLRCSTTSDTKEQHDEEVARHNGGQGDDR